MATRSSSSRERILSSTESIILQKGFSATSIKDIIDNAAITKSGFFIISLETLANMFTGLIEGGIMLARSFENNQLLSDQVLAYRSFARILYGAK